MVRSDYNIVHYFTISFFVFLFYSFPFHFILSSVTRSYCVIWRGIACRVVSCSVLLYALLAASLQFAIPINLCSNQSTLSFRCKWNFSWSHVNLHQSAHWNLSILCATNCGSRKPGKVFMVRTLRRNTVSIPEPDKSCLAFAPPGHFLGHKSISCQT